MKNLKIKHLILFALVLPLITQMFNTANLYQSISNLYGWERLVASYFVGVSFEISIFVCILSGSRSAGAWFAVLSFVVGIFFHDSWDYFIVDFQNVLKDPVHIGYHKKFYYTTLLQFINSVLVWFLSELYVSKIKLEGNLEEEKHLNNRLHSLRMEVADLSSRSTELNTITVERERSITEANKRLTKLEQEIVSLQKKKAGMSRTLTE